MRTEPAVTMSVLSAVVFVIAYFASNCFWSPTAWSARQGYAPRHENKIATTVIDSIALRETIATSLIRVSCNVSTVRNRQGLRYFWSGVAECRTYVRPAPRVQSTALLAALRAALLRLLYFGFGCVGVLLLIIQLCFHVEIGFRLPVGIRMTARLRAGRNAIFALFLGESLETLIELFAEVVVHLLQIVHSHRHLRT